MTNNTSLVLAIDLAWRACCCSPPTPRSATGSPGATCKWRVDGKPVTGPDLLARTVYYKVGHHGSHNATLREQGLELMTKLGMRSFRYQRGWR